MAAEEQVTYYRYVVPTLKFEGWGEFVIGSNGFFAAVSDYGNYAFRWRNIAVGLEVRRFVIQLEPDYLLSKIARRDEFDVEGTVQNIKGQICEERRRKDLTKEDARETWDAADRITNSHEASIWYDDYASTVDVEGTYTQRYSLDSQDFAHKLFPRLKELIRRELGIGNVPVL